MPREKLKPKEFDDYRKEAGPTIEKQEKRLTPERTEKIEGDYIREDKKEDYFSDKRRAEEDRGEPPPRKQRAVKRNRKLIRNFPTRYTRRGR